MINLPNTFAKGENLTFALNKSLVIAAVSDSYWSDSANISKCIVVYASTEGHQRKRLEFDFSQESPTVIAEWSVKARNAFEIEEIVLIDFDGGSYTIPHASLPSGKGMNFGGGAPVVTPLRHNYVVNGSVRKVFAVGNDLYAGGDFTHWRFQAPYVATINPATSENMVIDQTDGKFPVLNGEVRCAVMDGASTMYICGNFTTIDGVARNRIAKLNYANGVWSSDATFNNASSGRVGFNQLVTKIIVDGDDLFVCGTFTTYTGPDGVTTTRPSCVKISKTDGTLRSFNAGGYNTVAGGCYNGMVLDGNHLYLAGRQSWNNPSLSGSRGYNIVKVDKTTGALAAGWPNIRIQADGTYSTWVYDLAIIGGSLYAAGFFGSALSVDGVSVSARYNVIKINTSTGAIDTGFSTPFAAFSSGLYASSVLDDGSGNLFVGGQFNTAALGKNLVKVSQSTGAKVSAFAPGDNVFGAFASPYVWSLKTIGSSVYAFGRFEGRALYSTPTTISGAAKLDITTGAADAAFDTKKNCNGTTYGAIQFGSNLMVFGAMTAWGGYERRGVAKLTKDSTGNFKIVEQFDTSNGMAKLDNEGYYVQAMALAGDSLIVGGLFVGWAGSTRRKIAKINATTGALDPVFAQGVFTSGVTSGQFDGFDTGNNFTYDLAVEGDIVYVVGSHANYIRKSSASGTTVTACPAWLVVNHVTNTETVPPGPAAGDSIQSILVYGDSLYLGGKIASWGGSSLSSYALVKINKTTFARDTGFVPPGDLSGRVVQVMAIFDGNLYFSGNNFAGRRINLNTGATVGTLAPNGAGSTLYIDHRGSMTVIGNKLYVSGGSDSVGYLKRFSAGSNEPDASWGLYSATANSIATELCVVGSDLISGAYSGAGTSTLLAPLGKNIYSLDLETSALTSKI